MTENACSCLVHFERMGLQCFTSVQAKSSSLLLCYPLSMNAHNMLGKVISRSNPHRKLTQSLGYAEASQQHDPWVFLTKTTESTESKFKPRITW